MEGYLRISGDVDLGVDRDGYLHVVFVNRREHLTIRVSSKTVELLEYIDGTRSPENMAQELGLDVSEVSALLQQLTELGVAVASDHVSLLAEQNFASRQLAFFADFAKDPTVIQSRLATAHVIVVGLGTIGGGILEHLVRAGLGGATAVDPDVVSMSNLARQSLFSVNDVGRPKVEAARTRLSQISAPLCFVGKQNALHSAAEMEALLESATLVINCADQPSVEQTSQWVGKACTAKRIPHILAGGYRTHLGFLGPTIVPGESACWRCFETHYAAHDPFGQVGWTPLKISQPTGGSLGPLGGIVSGIHAWEAVRVLTGLLPPIMTNRKAEIDFRTLELTWLEVPPFPDCEECTKARVAPSPA
jgi:molybdopterin/thiamine biosynthesis adenylyltransferase